MAREDLMSDSAAVLTAMRGPSTLINDIRTLLGPQAAGPRCTDCGGTVAKTPEGYVCSRCRLLMTGEEIDAARAASPSPWTMTPAALRAEAKRLRDLSFRKDSLGPAYFEAAMNLVWKALGLERQADEMERAARWKARNRKRVRR